MEYFRNNYWLICKLFFIIDDPKEITRLGSVNKCWNRASRHIIDDMAPNMSFHEAFGCSKYCAYAHIKQHNELSRFNVVDVLMDRIYNKNYE